MKVESLSGGCNRRSFFKKSHVAAAVAAAASPFNARGVVEVPQFVLVRPGVSTGGITITVRAHCLGQGRWIAAAEWGSQSKHLPFDGTFPSRWTAVFKSRSEAVEHAINLALRQINEQLGQLVQTKDWHGKVDAVTAWAADAIRQTRMHDESLPLRGLSVIDLCAGGLGGFGMGLTGLGAEVMLACEIDPEASAVYLKNVKPTKMHLDLCTLDGTKLTCDILTLGLLCQAFSKAGKRKGFSDPVLAKVYAHTKRLLREIQARVVIIECARQFLTQEDGKDAAEVRELLMKSGYRVQHRTLNAAGFGVAQSRERSFIVGIRLDIATDDILGFVFPEEQEPTACVADILEANVPATMDASQFVLSRAEPETRQPDLAEVGLMRRVKTGEVLDAQGYRLYSPMGLGATLTATGGGRAASTGTYLVNGQARSLTPREAYRMQGMPEWASHHPVKGHALKHAGNAIAVPVARELGRQLGALLGNRS
ncbi:MAG TPA: DNA cytosine methyltransferase [Polaromonas sp.]|uniref:DNA cytosine methyltransferase n=1 Tax=Polaromonas sp. TaxID=1869339 RepID=UPI002D676D00|nr:DNA cytosine methyltransferase [Polaromonas sp.]HYW57456.1 DNA cytosine methyltransferase [Polaromonas sp.]